VGRAVVVVVVVVVLLVIHFVVRGKEDAVR